MNHEQAAQLIQQAIPDAPKGAKMLVQVIGLLETSYARGWTGSAVGSFNWGAITGTYQGAYFEHGDSRPDPNKPGQQIKYVTKFRKYPNDAAGIKDLHDLIKRSYSKAYQAAVEGRFGDVSEGLYGYYLGTKPKAGAIYDHRQRVLNLLPSIEKVWGPVSSPKAESPSRFSSRGWDCSFLPTLRRGSQSPAAVAVLQRLLGLPPSGTFGYTEDQAVKTLQASKGLVSDGIVGPKTWPAVIEGTTP